VKNSVSGVVAFVCTLAGCGPRESVGDLGGMAGAVVTAGTSGSGMGQPGGSGPGGSGMESGGSGGAPVAVPCGSIEYPATAFYGPNVLDSAATAFPAGASTGALDFDFAARLSAGASLTVRMTMVDVSLPLPGPFPPNVWWMANAGDWLVTDFDLSTGVQNFNAHDTEKVLAMEFGFQGNGSALVEYFECGSATPTRSKTITWSTGD